MTRKGHVFIIKNVFFLSLLFIDLPPFTLTITSLALWLWLEWPWMLFNVLSILYFFLDIFCCWLIFLGYLRTSGGWNSAARDATHVACIASQLLLTWRIWLPIRMVKCSVLLNFLTFYVHISMIRYIIHRSKAIMSPMKGYTGFKEHFTI